MVEQSHTPAVHEILKNYARWPHHTHDLMISVANSVERALIHAGVEFSNKGYAPGVVTRLYSRSDVNHFPDSNIRYLKSPHLFRHDVVDASTATAPQEFRDMYANELRPLCDGDAGQITNRHIRDIHRAHIAALVGDSEDVVRDGYIKRLLDRPDICDLLIRYYNEHKIGEFRNYIANNRFYRLGQHRLHETKNSARHKQPATLGSYIARTFCPNDMPAILSAGRGESATRDERLAVRADLIKHLPIDPDSISRESLRKVGLAPADFDKYTKQARRRYKMAVAEKFLALLSEAKMTERPHAGVGRQWENKTTARVITFMGADGEEKIGIFSTVTALSTRVRSSGDQQKNAHHRLADTELRIFAGREEARKWQEKAIEEMEKKVAQCAHLYNELSKYHKKKGHEKAPFLRDTVDEAMKVFGNKQSFHHQLILRYLSGSSEGKPIKSIIENPSLIGTLRSVLSRSMEDLKAKIKEFRLLMKQI